MSEAEAHILDCERSKSVLCLYVTKKCATEKDNLETAIRVTRLDPNIFSGDMRSYGTFKNDSIIVPVYRKMLML